MIIDLNDEQKKLLLVCIGQVHMVEYMKGKDNSMHEEIIKKIHESLKKENKEYIFLSVFNEK